jgi:hypothetical protein
MDTMCVCVEDLSILPFPNFHEETYGLPANYSLVSLKKHGGGYGH